MQCSCEHHDEACKCPCDHTAEFTAELAAELEQIESLAVAKAKDALRKYAKPFAEVWVLSHTDKQEYDARLQALRSNVTKAMDDVDAA